MNLRDYQEAAVTAATEHLAKGVNPLVIAPTGAGKTVIASEIMRRWQVANPGKPCYFVAHRVELLEQAERTMQKFGIVGKVLSVFQREFEGIGMTERREALVIFDEAHHAVASSWARFSTVFTGPKVAVTATPDRMDRQKLEAVGFDPCYEIAIRTLIEQGHLVRPMAYKMPVELSGILMRGYDEPMEAIADSIVEEMKRYDRKKAIAFLPAHKVARLTREFQISILSTGGADENAKEAAKSRLEAALLRQLRKVRSFRGLALHASAHRSATSSLFTGTQLP